MCLTLECFISWTNIPLLNSIDCYGVVTAGLLTLTHYVQTLQPYRKYVESKFKKCFPTHWGIWNNNPAGTPCKCKSVLSPPPPLAMALQANFRSTGPALSPNIYPMGLFAGPDLRLRMVPGLRVPGPTDFVRCQCGIRSGFSIILRLQLVRSWQPIIIRTNKYIASCFGLQHRNRWVGWTFWLKKENEMFRLAP